MGVSKVPQTCAGPFDSSVLSGIVICSCQIVYKRFKQLLIGTLECSVVCLRSGCLGHRHTGLLSGRKECNIASLERVPHPSFSCMEAVLSEAEGGSFRWKSYSLARHLTLCRRLARRSQT